MHMLAFLYPAAPGHSFDAVYWKQVHLPLGLGLTDKYLGLRPRRILLLAPGQGGDLSADTAPYAAVAMVMFDTRAEVERFSTLFEFEEAAQRLSADFPNYTAGPPDVLVSEVASVEDIDAMIAAFRACEAGGH
jgi:hypothetical protein